MQINFNMQIHSAAFRQENLAMKKREQNIKFIIPFLSTSANLKAIFAKQHISQTSDQSTASNCARN